MNSDMLSRSLWNIPNGESTQLKAYKTHSKTTRTIQYTFYEDSYNVQFEKERTFPDPLTVSLVTTESRVSIFHHIL